MKMSRSEKVALAKKHAFAVLQDSGKVLPTASIDRVMPVTMLAMLGVTFQDGSAITKGSAENALLHWHNTGFGVYVGNPNLESKKQRSVKDARLIKTAVAETMKNRRAAPRFSTKVPA